ncbi:hypothetical protein ABZ234_26740 [Nocardiopsis sp. NPDC006198]|uniref:hypothetical protein n=1 Tax=Nocardiopsis sp. NPDC006198 TaxID=3154472 RepID=UPI0033A45FC4
MPPPPVTDDRSPDDGTRLDFDDLPDAPAFAQALDNQWMPPDLAAERQDARPWDGTDEVDAAAGAELRRALVNSGTLLVNRAFLLNNPVLNRHYAPGCDPGERAALAALLDERAIIPYLLYERSADERPAFTVDDGVFDAWTELVRQTRPACLRYSWDDEANSAFTADTNRFFTERVARVHELAPHRLAEGLDLPREQVDDMRRTLLREVAAFAAGAEQDTGQVTRSTVYQRFLTREGTLPHERLLREGDHVVPVKHLVDLVYNTALPTLGGANAHTPPQSPPRSVLQELDGAGPEADPEALARLLTTFRGVYADTLYRALDGPNSYTDLSLQAVVRLRASAEWRAYTDAVGRLTTGLSWDRVPDAEEFAELTRAAARSHAQMLRTARRLGGPAAERGGPRSIVTDLVLQAPGMTVTVLSEDNLVLAGLGVAAAQAPLVARLVFRDRFSPAARSLSHSITFPTMRLGNAKSDLDDIVRLFREDRGRVHADDRVAGRPSDQQVNDEE